MREKANRISNTATVIIFFAFIFGFALILLITPDVDYLTSERRQAATLPPVSKIADGDYAEKLESYLADNFPARDIFRRVKVSFASDVLMQSDVNGYRKSDGSEYGMVYPTNLSRVGKNSELFENIAAEYFAESKIYYTLIPDKSSYLADCMTVDLEDFENIFSDTLGNYAEYIDISGELSGQSYFNTDIHWKQEKLSGVLSKLSDVMGFELFDTSECTLKSAGDFYGVLYGQAAFSGIDKDSLNYIDCDIIKGCKLTADGKTSAVYDLAAAESSDDKYDLFLGGEAAVTLIENDSASSGRRLIVFRDSFARSLVPLMLKSYDEVVLIDLRWIKSGMLDEYADILSDGADTDVLFISSTQVLNSMVYK